MNVSSYVVRVKLLIYVYAFRQNVEQNAADAGFKSLRRKAAPETGAAKF
jgi:hypothetical protein